MTSRYLTVPSQAVLSAGLVSVLQGRLPEWDADESDPGVYWADDTAAKMIELTIRANLAADATFILTAEKPAIYDLLREVGVVHIPAHEGLSLEALRRIYFNALLGLNLYVPDNWLDLCRVVEPGIGSLSFTLNLSDNEVLVYVVDEDGEDYAVENKTVIQEYLNHPSRKPLWDFAVSDVTITPYTVDAQIHYEVGVLDIEELVVPRLEAFFLSSRIVGHEVSKSAITNGMWADGVRNIILTAPVADLVASDEVIYHGSIGVLTYVEVS